MMRFGAIALACAAGIAFFLYAAAPETRAWDTILREEGGEAAYEAFALAVAHLSPPERHERAHRFGAALYRAEGLQGIGVCDQKFSYGCFHEFIGHAIHEHGLGAVETIDRACHRDSLKTRACQHGIGHGLVAHLGYGVEARERASEACRALGDGEHYMGCLGGVFMEYNMRTVLPEEGPRRFTDDPFEPCAGLTGADLSTCTFWLPQWWNEVLFDTDDVRFARMGTICRDATFRDRCLAGIGYVAFPEAPETPARARELCRLASEDLSDEVACRARAAETYSMELVPDAAGALCEGLDPAYHALCMKNVR